MTPKDLQSFDAFWPYYLAEHRLPACRAVHYFGTALATGSLIAIIALQAWAWIWLVLIVGYGPAWFGHFVIEKNRPATFTYPGWSLLADYKMFWMFITGRIDQELDKHKDVVFRQTH